ncbi:MAG: pyrroline-5-carboxylate reductase [Bacteroidota bacterium]
MERKKEHPFVTNEEASTRGEKISLNRAIAIIGAGNMGTSLLRGILDAKLAPHDKIIASGTHSAKLEKLGSKWKINHTLDNVQAAQFADILMLCVKPYTIGKVLDEIRAVLRQDQMLISIAAGVTIDSILQRTGKNNPIVRAMPNIASTVDEGATAVSFGRYVTEEHQRIAISIFEAVGEVVVVEESQLDAVTGLSGSGPAYIYMVIEALIDGGVKMGLPRDIATKLSVQTVLGSAKLVKESNLHPAILRDQVTTPGGTAINAVHELESHGLRSMLINAVATATKRSQELSEMINK